MLRERGFGSVSLRRAEEEMNAIESPGLRSLGIIREGKDAMVRFSGCCSSICRSGDRK